MVLALYAPLYTADQNQALVSGYLTMAPMTDAETDTPAQTQSEMVWSAFCGLTPRLLAHIEVHPQQFRGRRWYVLHDTGSGQHLRLNKSAFALVGKLDGERTLENIVAQCQQQSISMTPADALDLLQRLQAFGALGGFVVPEARSLTEQRRLRQRQHRNQHWSNPLAVRIPLLDPDKLLERWNTHLVVPRAGIAAIAGVLMLIGLLLLSLLNWPALNAAVAAGISMPHNLALVWCLYPLLKGIHEFAHAICLKRAGGEVHEMGITLLVFMPVPYVDASAAWSIRSRNTRILVSAAGILAEMTVAFIALLMWLLLEPGLLRDAALVLFTIGTLSTLLFNANPLLRFDGYYMLQDYLEIPNLYSRAQLYLRYLALRYLLRSPAADRPQLEEDERYWLAGFGICALLYRNFIVGFIALWLASTLMLVGVLLALWLLYRQWLVPVMRFSRFVITDRNEEGSRWTVTSAVSLSGVLALALLLIVPMPQETRVQGMVWVPEQSQLYAGTDGVVVEVMARPGDRVAAGDVLLRLEEPVLSTRAEVLRLRIRVQELRVQASRSEDGIGEALARDELESLQAQQRDLQRKLNALVIRAPTDGVFATEGHNRLRGQYFAQGDFIGHVIDRQQMRVHVVIPANDIGPVRNGINHVEVRFAEAFDHPVPGSVVRETPSANHRLPGAVLGSDGGGGIALASGGDGKEALHKVFHLELAVPESNFVSGVGARAYVSLQHPHSSLGTRLVTATRQLFLRHLSGHSA